ncbi:enoyl-CoA delta isomerase 2 isoform X1 [Octopus sinensis]|uniref:Enoyl-CoA delta isomerase 2 isoform X1 n=2 Tax=Octopus sinensis TaxID=2607531 RepID=A0A6P7U584_9MOLL|nr:enoyl-CoA delta isomerase 2 isoform X1 [Octopus sinensis]
MINMIRSIFSAPKFRTLVSYTRSHIQHRKFHTNLLAMASHDAEFKSAKDNLGTLKEDPGNMAKLQLYALFKQASIGDCNAKKPSMVDFVGKAKYDAWNKLKGMSQDEAQLNYIKTVNELVAAEAPAKTEPSGSTGNYKFLLVECKDSVFKITFNRPAKRNAITIDMYYEIINALQEATTADCSIAVVTGAGEYFCSGNDLNNFANVAPENISAMAENASVILGKFVRALIDFPKPLIALVNGPAVGISVTALGLFDAVYASDKATFHTPFSSLGQSPEGCSSYVFPKIMGTAKASEILLFNKKLTAKEAFERNLVSEVIPHGSFAEETEAKVKLYASFPPQVNTFLAIDFFPLFVLFSRSTNTELTSC